LKSSSKKERKKEREKDKTDIGLIVSKIEVSSDYIGLITNSFEDPVGSDLRLESRL